MRESRESGPAGRDQPDFVSIPMWANGIDDRPALGIGPAQERQEHPHPEVEAFQKEETYVKDCYQDEPENVEIHISSGLIRPLQVRI